MSPKMKWNFKMLVFSMLYFGLGFYLGHFLEKPKNISFGGKQFKIHNDYIMNVWFHESGLLAEIDIDKVANGEFVLYSAFYPNEVTRQFTRLLPNGIEANKYYENGILQLRSFNDRNDKPIKTEYYAEDGTLKETKDHTLIREETTDK